MTKALVLCVLSGEGSTFLRAGGIRSCQHGKMKSGRLVEAWVYLWLFPRLVEGRSSAFLITLGPQDEVTDGLSGGARKLAQLQASAPAISQATSQIASSRLYSPDFDEPVQRQALMDLYISTSGPTWTLPSSLPPSLQNEAAAPTADVGVEEARANFLTEQLTKFHWGTPNTSYCLWHVLLFFLQPE